jgi:hypothetical protein
MESDGDVDEWCGEHDDDDEEEQGDVDESSDFHSGGFFCDEIEYQLKDCRRQQ